MNSASVAIFATYPSGGHELFGRLDSAADCRRGYGPKFMRLTGQTACAYCGVSLIDDYYRWLLLCLDHVVPKEQAKHLGIPAMFYDDYINLVVCCSGCNGYANRYSVQHKHQEQWTLEDFVTLRNAVFIERSERIAAIRANQQALFATRPWEAVAPTIVTAAIPPTPDIA